MNDFLFLLVVENLRPVERLPRDQVAWFSVVPELWRTNLASVVSKHFGVDAGRAPFLLARALTSVVFFCLALGLAWRAARVRTPADWLEVAFLTVAWFWLLLPTQNPWYWTWALPLLPFARSSLWRGLSCLVFLYYFRFWLLHHNADSAVFGTVYTGPWFFDYVVTWVQYAPWFVALAASSLRGWTRPRR